MLAMPDARHVDARDAIAAAGDSQVERVRGDRQVEVHAAVVGGRSDEPAKAVMVGLAVGDGIVQRPQIARRDEDSTSSAISQSAWSRTAADRAGSRTPSPRP